MMSTYQRVALGFICALQSRLLACVGAFLSWWSLPFRALSNHFIAPAWVTGASSAMVGSQRSALLQLSNMVTIFWCCFILHLDAKAVETRTWIKLAPAVETCIGLSLALSLQNLEAREPLDATHGTVFNTSNGVYYSIS